MDQKNENRMLRINKIFKAIEKCSKEGKPADKEKVIAVFSLDTGTSRKIILEYLKTLITAGRVEETKEGLYAKGL